MHVSLYSYYFLTAPNLSTHISTPFIKNYLTYSSCFEPKVEGYFTHKTNFCTIQLMYIDNYDNDHNNTYDPEKTNYIAAVTPLYPPEQITQTLNTFADLLGWQLFQKA